MARPQDTSTEPSIEEILDSIRQIISDDEEQPSASAAAAPAPAQEKPAPRPADDDIIELTDRVEEPKSTAPQTPPPAREPEPQPIEVDIQDSAPEPMAEPEPEPLPPPRPTARPAPPAMSPSAMTPEPLDNLESIVTKAAEAATMKAFSELTHKASVEKGGGVTIEDIVRYEVLPLLRAWIDKYLPGIVERLLQKELEKISARFEQD